MSKSASAQPKQLTDQAALNCTIGILKRHFDLSAEGYLCQTHDLYRILVNAAAHCSTIEAACADLKAAPDSNTVRGYLNAQLTPAVIRDLEHQCNQALIGQWPHWLWSMPLDVAVDLHDECYYGESDDSDPASWVCRGEKRNGTTRFYRCATLAVIRRRIRVTLALAFVHPDDDLREIVQKLLKSAQKRGVQIGCLYADKQFGTIPILRDLQTQAFAVMVPVPRRGKSGGVNGLCHGRASYFTTHTFASQAYGQLTAPMAVIRAFKTEHGKRTATWLVFVIFRVTRSLRSLRETYRGRFGIETDYRSLEAVRARTTSTNSALRFFFIGLACLLGNVWMALQWAHCRLRGSGPRRIRHGLLTLERLARFLIRAIEAYYGVVSEIASL
ncbi:MAG TPA: hypothetical protein VF478_07600 [Anaerolineae bacterium]